MSSGRIPVANGRYDPRTAAHSWLTTWGIVRPMNWTSIVFAGLAGAIAGMLARVIANPKENKNAYTGAFVILFAVLYFASKSYAVPWWEMRSAEHALLEVPAFRAIKEHDPATYAKLMADVKDAIEKRKSKPEVVRVIRAQMQTIVEKRLPIASDEAAVEYIRATMVELDELYKRGDDTCHQFLFPAGALLDSPKYLSKKALENDLKALAKVIETSARNPQEIPEESEAIPHLRPVFEDLAASYGEDVAVIQNPTAAGVDKRKVCEVVSDMYSRILILPEGGKVLRYMVSQG